jgi:hypothetical protein
VSSKHVANVDGGRNSAETALAELSRLGEAHEKLCRTVDDLSRRNNLAEGDAAQLSKLNAELLSHANPHQKIMHISKLRAELSEAKKVYNADSSFNSCCMVTQWTRLQQKHLATVGELSAAQDEIATLQSELDSLKSVDVPARTLQGHNNQKLGRSRVARPALAEVNNLKLPTSSGLRSKSLGGSGGVKMNGEMSPDELL